MKTHDEIKNGIECCEKYMNGAPEEECCHVCNYQYDCAQLKIDIIALIRQLEAQNAEKAERIQQLEAERDAAVKDCGCFPCQTCEERENGDLCRMCEIEGGYRSFHQWRGVQKEDNHA